MSRKRAEGAARALGASQPLGTAHLMIFVPSADRNGKKLRGSSWTKPTLRTLGRLFRGATAYPKGLGVWRDDAAEGKLIFDDTTIVFSYIAPEDLTPDALGELREFLHRLGRDTNQGEVGLVLDGHYIGIAKFDEVRQ
jgi:hypothetical protein